MELEPFEVTDEHAFVICGPVACVIWRCPTIPEASIRGTEAFGRAALERSPRGAGLLFFPEGTTPSRELRELSTQINERLHAAGGVGVAGVFLQPDLVGAVQRGIAAGMAMLSAQSYPLQIFGDTVAACAWLGGKLRARRVAFDPAEGARRIETFRIGYLAAGAGALAPSLTD